MKNETAIVLALFLVAFIGLPATAVRSGLDGVDYGTVQSATALFQDSSASSPQVGPLAPGAVVVLVSREPSNGFLDVIKISTGREGWVRRNRVKIHYTNHHNPEIQLSSDASNGVGDPTLNIKNNSERDLYLRISSLPEIDVPGYSSKQVTVSPGVHGYNASSANVLPQFGQSAFATGMVYSWTYILVDHTTHNDHQATAEQIDQFNQDEAAVKVSQQNVDNLAAALIPQKTSLDDRAAKLQGDQADVDSRRATLDTTDQSAVDSFNSLVDMTNQELTDYQAALASYNSQVDNYNAQLEVLRSAQAKLQVDSDEINKQ